MQLPELPPDCASEDAQSVETYLISGIEKFAPSLMPPGQRAVTILALV